MRIGVIGLGRMGKGFATLLGRHPDVSELVVATRTPGRATAIAGELGVRAAGSVAELLARGLDGLVIATATIAHPDLVERAATAGVTTFCEKPVALDTVRTGQLLRHVSGVGATVQVGFQRRFDPGYAAARQALHAGALGDLRRVHLVSADPQPSPAEFVATSGGMFRDLTVHDIDVLRWVTGREIAEVYAVGVNRGAAYFAETGDIDEGAALLTLDDGTLVTVHGSRYNGAGHDVRMELAGTADTYAVGLSDRSALRSAEPGVGFPHGAAWTSFWDRFEPCYRAEMHAFVDLVAGRITNPCSIADALAASVVTDALERSRAEHRPVRIDRDPALRPAPTAMVRPVPQPDRNDRTRPAGATESPRSG
jgi:myo-inositol 2-dehydrogenase / D-chiro-inositol 1-dehydrogenase